MIKLWQALILLVCCNIVFLLSTYAILSIKTFEKNHPLPSKQEKIFSDLVINIGFDEDGSRVDFYHTEKVDNKYFKSPIFSHAIKHLKSPIFSHTPFSHAPFSHAPDNKVISKLIADIPMHISVKRNNEQFGEGEYMLHLPSCRISHVNDWYIK